MATLILVRSGRKVIARCDENCYNAKSEKCECVCGGKNHGVGLQKATEQTTEEHEEWADAYISKNRDKPGFHKAKAQVSPKIKAKQLDLFQDAPNKKPRPY